MKKKTSQNFVLGAVILMVSNLLSKIIGAVFKIPLTRIIGIESMAYFNAAYYIYSTFYMVSTAGIPVAISRMIAKSNSEGNYKEVRKIFKIAYIVFFVIGFAGMAAMILFSKQFAQGSKLDEAFYAIIAIAPTLFFICLSSAYRGYFQGLQDMVPTAVSQVIEAVGKCAIGLILGWYFTSKGYPGYIVAAYVILGVTIGVAAATVYIYITNRIYGEALLVKKQDMSVRSSNSIFKELCITSVPIALSSMLMGLTNIVDTSLVTRGLMNTGMLEKAAVEHYGAYTSMSMPLFNMPPTLIYPFAISAIPVLSSAIAKNDNLRAMSTLQSSFRIAALISVPCALGLSAFANPIIKLLYRNEEIYVSTDRYVNSVEVGASALSIVAIGIFFLSVISITNSILQAYRKEYLPIVSCAFGIVAKTVSEYFLLKIPDFGVNGAAISTLLCYVIIMLFNTFFVVKYTGYIPKITRVFAKPLASGVLCCISALLVYNLLEGISFKLALVLGIGTAVAVYVATLAVMKGFYREDIEMLPKGELLCSLLSKIHALSE